MPTRNASHEVLGKAVSSIIETAGEHKDDLEILLRIDDDDQARVPVAHDLINGYGSYVIGPRGRGYNDMGRFVHDLVSIANSKWCWLFDDDSWVEGDWYSELSKLPCDAKHGPAANADFYVLGESYYKNGCHGGAPGLILPTEFCRTIDHQNPVDQQWLNVVRENGWSIKQLENVNYHHDGRRR